MKLHQKLFLLLVLLSPLQLGRHFWPEWSYVMGLRVDYLSPTIYLTDILVFLVLGIWILEKSKFQNPKSKINSKIQNLKFNPQADRQASKSVFFLPLVFVFLLTNCFFAQNQGVAIYKLVKIAELFLLGFYIVKNHYSLFTIHYSLVFAVIYSSLIAIVQFIKKSSLGGIFWWFGERTFNLTTPGIAKGDFFGRLFLRPYATFPHPNVLAGFILIAFILSAPLIYQKNKLLFTFYFLLFTFTILISFSQAVWLVGTLLTLIVLKNLKINKWLKRLICGGVITILVFYLIYLIKTPIFNKESFFQRIELAKISFQLIKQNPFIGVGLNNFIVNLPKFQQGQTLWLQPVHNIYLLVAVETGLVGLIIFLWLLFLAFKKLLHSHTPILLYSYISILLLGFFDHYWLTLQQTQFLFTIVLGLIWGNKESRIRL
jgi:O-antigen ligase